MILLVIVMLIGRVGAKKMSDLVEIIVFRHKILKNKIKLFKVRYLAF